CHNGAFLGPDAEWGDRAIGPAQEHPDPDQQKRADEHPESQFDDGVELPLGLRLRTRLCVPAITRRNQGLGPGGLVPLRDSWMKGWVLHGGRVLESRSGSRRTVGLLSAVTFRCAAVSVAGL